MPSRSFFSLLACLSLFLGFGYPKTSAATIDVIITNATFSPDPVTIEAGDTVRWTNADFVLYNVTSDTALWTSPTLSGGQTYSYTFTSVGTYPYHCAYHSAMKGTVVVRTKWVGIPGLATLLSPTNSEHFISHRPTFSWSTTSPAATWYFLWINKDGEFYQQQWVQDSYTNDLPTTGGVTPTTQKTNRWTSTNDLPNGTYTWAVQAWNSEGNGGWSAVKSFTIYAGAPGVAVLTAPTNTAYATSRRPDLQWTNALPAATWSQIWINKDGEFYLKEWVEGALIWRSTNDMPNGLYTWGVQTWNPDGYGAWSRVSSFTITSMVPGMATLVLPTNGQGGVGRRPQLKWTNAPPTATWYNLWINKDEEFFHQEWLETSQWTPTNDLASGRYSWGVQTWNEEGYGPWSTNSIFTIPYVLPGMIALDLAVVLDDDTVRYQWNADMAATWYQLWIIENGQTLYDKWYYTGVTTDLIRFEIDEHTSGKTYQWYVRGWNPDGYGIWCGPSTFNMP